VTVCFVQKPTEGEHTMNVSKHKESVQHMSLDDAAKLLSAASKEGIEHIVSVVRDPRNPERILSIAANELPPPIQQRG
jgi:predicted nucleic acid-binding protein